MSTKINDGGPAFPQPNHVIDGDSGRVEAAGWMSESGMSLRDYFAANAMQSLIVDPERVDQSREECARLAYLMADAMIAARGRKS